MELRESEYEDSRVLQLVKFAEELSAAGLINEAAAYLIEARETVVEMDTATSWCGAICVALITEVARAQADLGLTEDARETAMRGIAIISYYEESAPAQPITDDPSRITIWRARGLAALAVVFKNQEE